MTITASDYKTLVFDCDGVVLDSNNVKTQAFRQTALAYGDEAARRLVDFHVANGGISRYKKFALFLDEMVDGRKGPSVDSLLETYAGHVRTGLMTCEIATALSQLREANRSRWLIVSGGDQEEIREVFAARGISEHFDGGIYGSPDTKDEILDRELKSENIAGSALFLGDSTYDHRASTAAGLDFVFVSGWTEVSGWESWARENRITSVSSLEALL